MSLKKRLSVCLTLAVIMYLAISLPIEIKGYPGASSEYVKLENKTVRIASKYKKDCDLWIDFGKAGINSIMGISHLYLAQNLNSHVNPDLSRSADSIIKADTDWIGPYIVKANKSGDNSYSPSFTGGWHGIVHGGKTFPTAGTLSWAAYADNKKILSDKTIGCRKTDIYVTNLIQAYNSSARQSHKAVLQEKVHYCIENRTINVSVEIKALEDVTILKYYGLQVQDKPWMDKVFYQIGSKFMKGAPVEKYTTSGQKKYNPGLSKLKLNSKDMRYGLTVELDRKYGLGNMKYVSSDKPCAFTMGYGKTYFNLINGVEKVLYKGQKLYWKGLYSFI